MSVVFIKKVALISALCHLLARGQGQTRMIWFNNAWSCSITSTSETNVTRIDLKNFAWNIAFQHNIGGDITAQFVMQTFNEWVAHIAPIFCCMKQDCGNPQSMHAT